MIQDFSFCVSYHAPDDEEEDQELTLSGGVGHHPFYDECAHLDEHKGARIQMDMKLELVSAVGLRRALHPGKAGTWGPILVGLYGIFLIIAGCFHPDPQLGFPSGAQQGLPSSPSGHATIHSIAFSILALAIVASGFVFARRFVVLGKRGWMSYTITSSVGILIFVFLGNALMGEGLGGLSLLGAAITISFWVSAIAVQTLHGIDENSH